MQGKKPSIVDASTGDVVEAELFVAVLGASNYTYAEGTYTQQGDMPRFCAHCTASFGAAA